MKCICHQCALWGGTHSGHTFKQLGNVIRLSKFWWNRVVVHNNGWNPRISPDLILSVVFVLYLFICVGPLKLAPFSACVCTENGHYPRPQTLFSPDSPYDITSGEGPGLISERCSDKHFLTTTISVYWWGSPSFVNHILSSTMEIECAANNSSSSIDSPKTTRVMSSAKPNKIVGFADDMILVASCCNFPTR